jgi:hypothetical protein
MAYIVRQGVWQRLKDAGRLGMSEADTVGVLRRLVWHSVSDQLKDLH